MIGIMMLNTRFPRFLGDIGNADSFNSPPLYALVEGANVNTVVSGGPIDQSLIDNFIHCAKGLESKGATVIGTSCGFLASAQNDIQQGINVPFLSSSLVLTPLLKTMFGNDAPIGVLTFDANKLSPLHFNGALDDTISIHGLDPTGPWHQCIANNTPHIEEKDAMDGAMEVATRCINAQPDTRAILIECTNLSPFKNQMRKQFGLPVFDLVDALQWVERAK